MKANVDRTKLSFLSTLLWAGIVQLVSAAVLVAAAAPKQPSQNQPASRAIMERALLEFASQVDLRSEAGRPLPVLYLAPAGKVVKKGTLVAELDARALLEQLTGQRALLETAKAHLEEAEASLAGESDESRALIEVAEQALVVAEGALELFLAEHGEYRLEVRSVESEILVAEKRFEVATARASQLKNWQREDPEVQNEIREAELTLTEARAQLESAKARLVFLEKHVRDHKTAELKLAVARRKLELIRARNGLSSLRRSAQTNLAAARSHCKLETSKLARLERQVAACKIYAPRDGVVVRPGVAQRGSVGESTIEPGAIVRDGETILRVADRRQFKLDFHVPLKAAYKIIPGQEVEIRLDAFPGRSFRGRVTGTRVLLDRPKPPTGAGITVRVDDVPEGAKAGMTATVEFDLSKNN